MISFDIYAIHDYDNENWMRKNENGDKIEIGCDLELDSISVFITENEWAMHKYDLEMGVDCG